MDDIPTGQRLAASGHLMNAVQSASSLLPFTHFEDKVDAWLEQGHAQMGHRLWFLARLAPARAVVLRSLDGFGCIPPGTVLRLPCELWRAEQADGVHIIPSLLNAALCIDDARELCLQVRSWMSAPLQDATGHAYAALFAMDSAAHDDSIHCHSHSLRFAARQLSTIFIDEQRDVARQRDHERTSMLNSIDPSTGLFTTSAWRSSLAVEEQRCHRLGNPCGAIAIRIQTSTEDRREHDRALRRIGWIVRSLVQSPHLAARTDDHLLGVLCIDIHAPETQSLTQSLRAAFDQEQLPVRLAHAQRDPASRNLPTAWLTALRDVV